MINVFSPSLGQSELLAIADSFNTGWIGKGPKVAEFEAAWAQHIGVSPENVVSVSYPSSLGLGIIPAPPDT